MFKFIHSSCFLSTVCFGILPCLAFFFHAKLSLKQYVLYMHVSLDVL